MDAANTETLLARWLSGELSEEELKQLQQREDFADLQSIAKGMEGLAPPAFDEKAAWEKLNRGRRIHSANPPHEEGSPNKLGGHRIIPMRRILSIAAAVVALLAAGWWFFAGGSNPYDNTFATSAGEHMEFKLPDGSTVHLNAASVIEYASSDWPSRRNLRLDGEAHFRVKKGSTFNVLTDQGEVRVVGTIFNVNVRDGEMAVKCTHGKVQVVSSRDKKVILKAGEQVSVVEGQLQRRQGIDFTPKWFQGESVFKTTPLPKVFDELERQFNVTVVHGDLEDRSFSGKFKHESFDDAAARICRLMQLNCTVNGDTLRVE
jgi:ferric-dicitrate binding protein FerR (iron transport regulator)